jgi:hypothetical protein
MPKKCIFVSQKEQNWVLKHPEPGQDDVMTQSLALAISRARQIDPHAVVLWCHPKTEANPTKKRKSDVTQ